MLSFLGSFEYSVDPKGRVSVPSIFRTKIKTQEGDQFVENEHFVIQYDSRGCLNVYNTESWIQKQEKYAKLDDDDVNVKHRISKFLRGAQHVYTDTTGRITVPQHLFEKAQLKKNVTIQGRNNWFEIWNPEAYIEYDRLLDSFDVGSNPDKKSG